MRVLFLIICSITFIVSIAHAAEKQIYSKETNFFPLTVTIETFGNYKVIDIFDMCADLESAKNHTYLTTCGKIYADLPTNNLTELYKQYTKKANEMIKHRVSSSESFIEKNPEFASDDVISLGENIFLYSAESINRTRNLLDSEPEKYISFEVIKLEGGLEIVNATINLHLSSKYDGPTETYNDLYYNGEVIDNYYTNLDDIVFMKNSKGDIFMHSVGNAAACEYIDIFKPTKEGFIKTAHIAIEDGECI